MDNTLTIGQLAKRAGVNIETLRFYERERLISSPPRRISGYRQYSPGIVDRILFIKQAKVLGFSLKEISELLLIRDDGERSAADVKKMALDKILDIETKIASLQSIRNELAQLTSMCKGKGPISTCPIMNSLQGSPEESA